MTDRRCTWWLAILLAALACARTVLAGGGPENVLLVVNSTSWASMTVANHFIQLRAIPPINVFYVDWTGGFESVDGETMRQKILMPALEAAEKRGLFHQIDYVLYSSDFPYAVNLSNDFPGAEKFPAQYSPSCSINSATFLWHMLLARTPMLMDTRINTYMRSFSNIEQKIVRKTGEPTLGFRSWYGWGKDGVLQEAGGQPYMLSTMLAVTSGRGNSVREAVDYLKRSAAADGTFPKGTIYFTRTQDVRSTKRNDDVASAIAELEKLGVRSQVVLTPMPQNSADVAGLISGVADFSWAQTRSRILPGAICDNFTSFGGVMTEGSPQSPLTEFLRYGAAGSAGTIIEPYAIPQKFASPNVFVHYARGCTLAEAYYQAIFAPAQVLIVGDALCRPWADIPKVEVAQVSPGAKVSATLVLKPRATFPKGGKVARYELFVDGRRAGTAKADDNLSWDSTTEADGYHELRVVAIGDGPIATQGRATIPVIVANFGQRAVMTTTPSATARWDEILAVDVKAPGMKQIYVLNNGRVLGRIDGAQGQLKLNPRALGLGPVSLQAIAFAGRGNRDRVVPPPVNLTVESAPPLPALAPQPDLAAGLVLQLADKRVVPIQETKDPGWLAVAGVGPNQPYIFQGTFDASADEVYQFQLWHTGALSLAVDDKALYSGNGNYTQTFVPVALAKGLHRLTVRGQTGTDTKLRILFGGPGALSLNGREFRHPRR
ncbi:MAG: TIGR03790 family protein [Pirellulales bacterium]